MKESDKEKKGLLAKIEKSEFAENIVEKEKKPRKRRSLLVKIFNRIIVILILIAVILFAVYFLFGKKNPIQEKIEQTQKVETNAVMIRENLSYWQEFVTFKYRYSDILTVKKTGWITQSYSIVKYSGIIRAGIADITESQIEIMNDGKKLYIKLPEAEILGNEIESQEIFDEQRSVFLPLKTQEIFDKIEEEKNRAQEDLVTDGLLKNAKDYAVKILTQLFKTAGFEEVVVE